MGKQQTAGSCSQHISAFGRIEPRVLSTRLPSYASSLVRACSPPSVHGLKTNKASAHPHLFPPSVSYSRSIISGLSLINHQLCAILSVSTPVTNTQTTPPPKHHHQPPPSWQQDPALPPHPPALRSHQPAASTPAPTPQTQTVPSATSRPPTRPTTRRTPRQQTHPSSTRSAPPHTRRPS